MRPGQDIGSVPLPYRERVECTRVSRTSSLSPAMLAPMLAELLLPLAEAKCDAIAVPM